MSANIDPVTLSYEDKTVEHAKQPPISRHFTNRLYDRDTLLLSHYDVNFLFILSLYARNNAGAKESYKAAVRKKFRASIQKMLNDHFKFFAMQAHPDVDGKEYFTSHFKDIVGKTFSPYQNEEIFSLALDMSDPESQPLIDALKEHFYIAECELGKEPSKVIQDAIEKSEPITKKTVYDGNFLTCLVRKSEIAEDETRLFGLFSNHQAEGKTYIMLNMPSGDDITEIKFLLPIVDNKIDGYYDISDVKFGSRKKTYFANDEEVKIQLPTLKIKIGQYHPFDKIYSRGIVPRMANQIWTPAYLKEKIFDKYNPYEYDDTDSISVEEPEAEYGSASLLESDYIE